MRKSAALECVQILLLWL